MIVAVADISSLDISSRKEENPWAGTELTAGVVWWEVWGLLARAVC